MEKVRKSHWTNVQNISRLWPLLPTVTTLACATTIPCLDHCSSLLASFPASKLGYSQNSDQSHPVTTTGLKTFQSSLPPISLISDWKSKPLQCPAKPHTICIPCNPYPLLTALLGSRYTDLPALPLIRWDPSSGSFHWLFPLFGRFFP